MSYNRWLAPDELYHHGVKDQEWGKRNGPPYPLYRQEKFRTKGPDGKPITSKVAYKKAQKNVRAANRAERKANPNGTPQDKKERNSFGAQIKRAYRQHKREQEQYRQKMDKFKADNKAFEEALERVNKIEGLTDAEQSELAQILKKQKHDRDLGGSWNAKELADEVNKFADQIPKKRRDAAKEHGTAEEVMKYRDTFNKDEWNEIAGRLEAEARVKKLLDRPLDSANSNQNQVKNQNQSKSQETTDNSSSGLTGKLKKIAEKGDAREVYQNRSKFTPEQLQTISRRLQAEETIARFADNQLLFKSDALRNLENIARYAQTAGNIATGVSTIAKAFGGNSGGGNGKQKNEGFKSGVGSITKNAHLIEEIQKKANEASKNAKKKAKKYQSQ